MDDPYADPPPAVDPPPPPARRRRWPWVAAVAGCVVIASVAASIVAGQRAEPEPQLSRQTRKGIEEGVLAKDALVSANDRDRELKVTSPLLRQPFTMTVPAGWEARRVLGREVPGVTHVTLIVSAPERDGFAPYITIEATTLPVDDLAATAQAVMVNDKRTGNPPGFDVVGGSVPTTVGSRVAVARDFTFTSPGGTAFGRGRMVTCAVGDRAVLFRFSTADTQFLDYEAAFTDFLASARGN